ncbi:RNA-binding protein [Patescibacteria group bacterium]|nr:RNA-binding protein [Patescibacteria group bacterium]
MSKKLFVGNISWDATEEDLQTAFAQFGAVEEAVIIKDKFSGRSKGFGFVTFENDEDGDKAISEMDGQDVKGRPITVNEARPQKPRE